MRWAAECREQPRAPGQSVFGIVQGGTNAALREECAKALVALKFDGYAIGGVSVGEPEPEMLRAVEMTEPFLPAKQPRYAMGLGTPAQMVELVARGVDMFDCVLPTRCARNGLLFTTRGRLNVKNARFAEDERPIDPACGCYACRTFTRAYLRHLFRAGEILALRLNTLHNLHHYLTLMEGVRRAIEAGRLEAFRRERLEAYRAGLAD
jgi:queuine tRNA-ribosyltransferase